ncbi:MAG: T9SS type A sorting domain-containing protein [Bacteroidales bacterium]|jgi:hypothetical protein|nr:T9SS type A sorting domain-containing protein [Bacteroidales bacterium]
MIFSLKVIQTISVITLFSISCLSQQWPKIFGDPINAYGQDLVDYYDKGHLICGSIMRDASHFKYGWLIKTDINGNLLWDKKFGNASYENLFLDFEKVSDQGLVISGATAKYDVDIDPLFVKINACGEIEWCRIFLSEGFNTAPGIITLPNGEYIGMLQYYRNNEQFIRISLVKMDTNGEPVWINYLAQEDSTIFNEEGYSLNNTPDSNLLVTGRCSCPNLKPFYIKTDTAGVQLWDIRWPVGNEGYAKHSVFSLTGMIYSATGLTFPGHPKLPYLLKFTSDGEVIDQYPLMGDTIVRGGAESLLMVDNINLYIGLSWTDDPTLTILHTDLLKTDTLGNLIILRRLINGGGGYPPNKIIQSNDEKILTVGHYYVDGNWDIYLWKMNKNLEDDTLYTQPLTYDSICPYEIKSDTVDLDCGVFVNIDEIPTKAEYESTVKISPNPATDWAVLTLPDVVAAGKVEIAVYDVFGRKVETGRRGEKEMGRMGMEPVNRVVVLDISGYPPGMYVVVVTDRNSKRYKGKLVVD